MQVVPLSRGMISDSFGLVAFNTHNGCRLVVMVMLKAAEINQSVAKTRKVNIARLRRVSALSHCVMFLAEVCSFVVALCSAT